MAGGRRIVGAHMVGHAGEELIHLFALAMRHPSCPKTVYGFPTFAADIRNMM